MKASKLVYRTENIFMRDDEGAFVNERSRRHIRSSSSSLWLTLIATLFCAACVLATFRNAAQVSELRSRLEKLEMDKLVAADLEANDGRPISEQGSDTTYFNLENFIGDTTMPVSNLFFNHRQKRQVEKKKIIPKLPGKPKANVPSAIHLSLVVHEPTAAEKDLISKGEVITLSYGNISLQGFRPKKEYHNEKYHFFYKPWKVATWSSSRDYVFNSGNGTVRIQRKGLYYIYSQILYHNSAARSSYAIMVGDEMFVKCMVSVDAVLSSSQSSSSDNAKYKTCYVGAARELNKGQLVYIEDLYGYFVHADPTANFFGLIKIADFEK